MRITKWIARVAAVLVLSYAIAKLFSAYGEAIVPGLARAFDDFCSNMAVFFGVTGAEADENLGIVIELIASTVLSAVLILGGEGLWRRMFRERSKFRPDSIP